MRNHGKTWNKRYVNLKNTEILSGIRNYLLINKKWSKHWKKYSLKLDYRSLCNNKAIQTLHFLSIKGLNSFSLSRTSTSTKYSKMTKRKCPKRKNSLEHSLMIISIQNDISLNLVFSNLFISRKKKGNCLSRECKQQ